jgi:diaminohydroxyphosphoribosylaminopyrimidine deaminase/5-amino-6-(5-phosphoribosylamino)uracil reductase
MRRCFDLAQLGQGWVSPNPMVGAVLVHEGQIIGEGWHQKWGGAHAEVHCTRSVLPENKHLIPYSTLYCSLEPCFHFGKTPPCVDLILEHKIPRVVVANVDPNPKVAGQSIEKMRAAGVEVISGILEEEGAWLNRSFLHWIKRQRPFVVLKWAQSADGFIGRKGERTPISGPFAQRLVHRWRSASDAILVGTTTAVTDNPKLDARLYRGKNPLRIVFDFEKKIPAEYNILDDSIETWVFGPQRSGRFQRTQFFPTEGKIRLEDVLSQLHQNIRATLLVEGGALLLQQFLDKGLWDEIRVIENEKAIGGGVRAPALPPNLVLKEAYQIGEDSVNIFMAARTR